MSAFFRAAEHDGDHYRRAEYGGNCAYAQLSRREHGACEQITEETEYAASQETCRNHNNGLRCAVKKADYLRHGYADE